MEQVAITKVIPTHVWIESDMFGGRHVMRQHEGMKPFCYCSFFYDYTHTSNGKTLQDATNMALSIGATEPVEHRSRELHWPTIEETEREIKDRQQYLATLLNNKESK